MADGPFQDRNGLIVNRERYRKRMAILAAVGEREARGVAESVRGAVQYFGHERHGGDCARTDPG